MIDTVAKEARSAELAIIILYPTSVSDFIVLLKKIKEHYKILLISLYKNNRKTI